MTAKLVTAKRIGLLFWLVVTIIPIVGIVISLLDPVQFYGTQQQYRAFLEKYARWAPLVFIGLQALQVIVTPLSHYSVGYMGGFLFGPLLGSVYNYIGRIVGHVSAFFLSRCIGNTIVRRFVPEKTLGKYDHIANRPLVLFLIYFLPLFPDDEISYLVGLSRMRFRFFLLANILGHLGGSMSLAYMGSGISTKDPLFWALTISTLAGFPVLWLALRRKPRRCEQDPPENDDG